MKKAIVLIMSFIAAVSIFVGISSVFAQELPILTEERARNIAEDLYLGLHVTTIKETKTEDGRTSYAIQFNKPHPETGTSFYLVSEGYNMDNPVRVSNLSHEEYEEFTN